MRTRISSFRPLLVLAVPLLAVLATGGCLAPRSSGTPDYYLLTALSSPAEPILANTTLGVGPVRVAPFLDRPQLVTHDRAGVITLREQQRWAEPLDKGIQRVMVQNLTLLTGANTRNFPWTRTTIPERALRLDVLDFNHDGAGKALLEVSWVLEDLKHNKLLAIGRERLEHPVNGTDHGALVEAYSALLESLAATIAARLTDNLERS
jgi:uncharacterized lipoprotein YmbA